MQIGLHDVGGQVLRVGVRSGKQGRPPLLLNPYVVMKPTKDRV